MPHYASHVNNPPDVAKDFSGGSSEGGGQLESILYSIWRAITEDDGCVAEKSGTASLPEYSSLLWISTRGRSHVQHFYIVHASCGLVQGAIHMYNIST